MKLLITGGRGFIGSVLSLVARERGHKIIAVDDYSRGLNDNPCITWDCRQGISHILDEFTYNKSDAPFDAVVHLAAGTGSLSRPYEELVELNVEMTKKVYFDAVEHNVKTFVFPTTSLVEGVPDAPYVRSKQDAMDWIMSRNDGINIIGLQFYNVTGSYNRFSEIRKLEVHIVPIMLECFMNNKPFVINGDQYDTLDGTPGRDFSNVVDVSEFILHLIGIQKISPFKSGGVIKVGTGRITTAKQMVDIFNKWAQPKFNKILQYEIGPIRPYDCGWLRCDQPYLHIFKKPRDIETSLVDELNVLLAEIYK